MNLRGTGYRFDKTNYYKRMKRNNDGKCLFLITQWKTIMSKIMTTIFRRWTIYFKRSKHMWVCDALERSRSKFYLRSRSRGDSVGHVAYELHLDETNTLRPFQHISISSLSPKRFVTLGYLIWCLEGLTPKTNTWVINGDLRRRKSEWMEILRCVKLVLEIFYMA